MKIFAFYLPQFHEIKENNEWHEPGFTEWNNVKRAVPLYKNHHQPQQPLDGVYYNLLEKNTIIKQTAMAKDHGVDGFIYYHYWFNGKRLMEKPAENFLKWKEIQHSFFFCWANHSFEKKWDGSNKLLQEQTYGQEKDWKEHFEYLMPFFKDDRYEKIDNKPLFMIYNPDFEEKVSMIKFFDSECRKSGFNGIYYIECFKREIPVDFQIEGISHVAFEHMPVMAVSHYKNQHRIKFFITSYLSRILKKLGINSRRCFNLYNADELIEAVLKDFHYNKNIWRSIFLGWDNTPRYGINGGSVIDPISQKVFFNYMNVIKDSPYLFVNAWNEWAEGMILEPTKEIGYKYLDWIKEWKRGIGD